MNDALFDAPKCARRRKAARRPRRFGAPVAAVWLALAVCVGGPFALVPPAAHAQTQTDMNAVRQWETFPWKTKRTDTAALSGLNLTQLKFLRGILFGKHGRVFDEAVIQNFLKSRSWYQPDPTYRVEILNVTERANMDAIKAAEHTKHKTIEPGDLKFFRTVRLTPAQLGSHTGVEWTVMQAEIEAIHGKTFPAEPWLQAFFDERYWYQRNPSYTPKLLTAVEKANGETIRKSRAKNRGLAVTPGDMGVFQNKPLTPALLHGLSLQELRLLRNEIFARRGQRFETEWLQDYFNEQAWYTPLLPKNKDATLTPVEEKNVALIQSEETALHDALSTRPLTPNVLEGLPVQDLRVLRNEIFARRGMEFKDPRLASYFRSLPWYKPDAGFSEAKLSAVERKNVTVVQQKEKELLASLENGGGMRG